MTRRIRGWDEQDAYTVWRHLLHWRPGELKQIKKRTHRRERREARARINDEVAADQHDQRSSTWNDRDYDW